MVVKWVIDLAGSREIAVDYEQAVQKDDGMVDKLVEKWAGKMVVLKEIFVAEQKVVAKVVAKAGLLALSKAPSLVGKTATTLAAQLGRKLDILLVG